MTTPPFTMPRLPSFCIESPHVLAYREDVVRRMRVIVQREKLTYLQLARRLRVRPQRAKRIIEGHVALDPPDQMYRWIKRLDPSTTCPDPTAIPVMTASERKKLQARMFRRVQDALDDPRPPIPHERVLADMREKRRAQSPLSYLKPEGTLRYRRYVAVYAHAPGCPHTVHGQISNRKDVVQFTAGSIAQLEQRFHRAVHAYEAFCNTRAVD